MTKTRQDVTQPWKRELALSDLHTNAGQTGQGTDARTPEARGLARMPARPRPDSQPGTRVGGGSPGGAAGRESRGGGSPAPSPLLPRARDPSGGHAVTALGTPPGCPARPRVPLASAPTEVSACLFLAPLSCSRETGFPSTPSRYKMFPQERNTINRA